MIFWIAICVNKVGFVLTSMIINQCYLGYYNLGQIVCLFDCLTVCLKIECLTGVMAVCRPVGLLAYIFKLSYFIYRYPVIKLAGCLICYLLLWIGKRNQRIILCSRRFHFAVHYKNGQITQISQLTMPID